ncbi:MAG TPA: aldehyde dehydrogenase family protein, partial [Gemmatimonadales bacterium]|nr:aldehyde dehydrogenase family protein [Gemmatimonadales bacterium]
MTFQSINPATGELLGEFPVTPPAAVEAALDRASVAWKDWRRRSLVARAMPFDAAARLLRERKDAYARLMALEMGKPLAQGAAEAEKCAAACEYYAAQADVMLAPDERKTEARDSYVRFDPLGVVLAIMPWNFPFWQVFRFAVPSLMAGNTALLKHAPNVPQCAIALAELFREAGFPEGVFQSLFVEPESVGSLIADNRVSAVTLTGSPKAGASVGEHAGRHLKRSVLELGGSDPFVVLEDADLPAAARHAAEARLINSGQSCIAAKRFIVVEKVADAFLERFGTELERHRVGDPLAPGTDIGPLARFDLRDGLHAQVEESCRRGAKLLFGGAVPAGPGAYYPVTLLTDVLPGQPAFDEETFGPVAAVMRARDERHAIELANTSSYGLGASLWTIDRARAERLAVELETGSVFVNA